MTLARTRDLPGVLLDAVDGGGARGGLVGGRQAVLHPERLRVRSGRAQRVRASLVREGATLTR